MSTSYQMSQQIKSQHHTRKHDIEHYKLTSYTDVIGPHTRINEIATSQSFTEGSQISFKIGSKAGNNKFLSDAMVVAKLSTVTATGTGIYKRLIDYPACFLFQKIEVFHNGTQLSEMNSQEIYQMLYLSHENHYWDSIVKKQLGSGTESERNTLANAAQELIIPLRIFKFLFDRNLPIFLLEGELEFRLTYNNSFASMVETDGTAPAFTVNNVYIETEYVENANVANWLRTEIKKNNSSIAHFVGLEPHLKQQVLQSGTTDYQLRFDEVHEKDVLFITMAKVPAVQVGKSESTYSKVDKYALKSSGTYLSIKNVDIEDFTYRKSILYSMHPLNIENLQTDNLYIISYASDLGHELYYQNPRHFNNWSKQLTSSRYFRETDVQMELKFDSNLAANDKIYLCCYEVAHYSLVGAGDKKVLKRL